MSEAGWIKLHRQLRKHWLMKRADYLRGWVLILMLVNHTRTKVLVKGKLLTVERGESVRSLSTWAKDLGMTQRELRTFLNLLKTDTMIDTQNEHVTTRLKVLNYDTYQDQRHANDTQNDKQTTRARHAGDTQTTTNKNDKKENKDKNEEEVVSTSPPAACELLFGGGESGEVDTRPTTGNAKDLQVMRLARLVSQQDFIDADELIEAHGWQVVCDTALALKETNGGRIPFPSSIRNELADPVQMLTRPKLIDALVQWVRSKWDIDTYVGKQTLAKLIERGTGWQKQFTLCQNHHGCVSADWIKDCHDDGSITYHDDPRTDDELRAILEQVTEPA